MKKKVVSILFALCLSACLLTACGGNDKTTESSSETKAETTVSAKDKEDDSKKEESETEKESETDDKKKDETKETGKTADNKKETSNSNSGSSASKTTSSANKSQNSSASQSSQPSTSSGNSSSASKPSTENSGSTSTPAPTQPADTGTPTPEPSEPAETQPSEPVHTHTWVWATHTETIPEQSHVVEVKKYVCNNCGAQFDDGHAAIVHCGADFWDNCENYTYKVVDSQTVIDVPAQTVTVNDYEYCSECGARK